jgi:N-acetylneuraminic acid mutarotase
MSQEAKRSYQWTCLSAGSSNFITRSSHGVTAIGNILYVFGGEHKCRHAIDNKLMAFDTTAENADWSVVDAKGTVPEERFAHTQAAVTNDQGTFLYIFAGRQGITMQERALTDMHRFNPNTSTWEAVVFANGGANMPSARSFHTMCAIGATLYVFGGCPADHAPRSNELFAFDTNTCQWTSLPTFGDIRGRGGATLEASADGKSLFVIAGFCGEEAGDMFQYHIEAQQWTQVPANFRPRSVVSSASYAGSILLFGGEVDPSAKGHEGAGGFANDLLVFDGLTGAAANVDCTSQELPTTRGWASADAIGTSFYLVGGLTGDDDAPQRLGDVWRLDLA